mgnify:CR=1 FL=1
MSRWLTLITLIALIMSILMAVLSAYIRLSESGIDCAPWPDCFQSSFSIDLEPGIAIEQQDPNRALRLSHRFMASAFGLLVVLLFTLAIWSQRRQKNNLLAPSLCLMITIVLAIVGTNSPDLAHPIVATTNLVGGMALAVILLWYLQKLMNSRQPSPPRKIYSASAFVLIFTSVASGAWVSANFAAGSCAGLCDFSNLTAEGFLSAEGALPAEGALTAEGSAFSPFRALEIDASRAVITPDIHNEMILAWHQYIAIFALLFVGARCLQLMQKNPRHAATLTALAGALVTVVFLEHQAHSVFLASLHNGLALMLLMTLLVQGRQHD